MDFWKVQVDRLIGRGFGSPLLKAGCSALQVPCSLVLVLAAVTVCMALQIFFIMLSIQW
jgi:hypothetical protein